MMTMNIASYSLIILLLTLQAPTRRILFFGDSLTAGYGLTVEQAFPALIEARLQKEGYTQFKVTNAGLSGETSSGGLNRIDWMLRQPVDIFVLELGANDGLRGIPVEATAKNLQLIIDRVKAKYPNARIVVAGMMVPPNMGPEYSSRFRQIFPELAKNNKATLIPFILDKVAGIKKLNQSDGIHPTPEGHQMVAQTVYTALMPLVKEMK